MDPGTMRRILLTDVGLTMLGHRRGWRNPEVHERLMRAVYAYATGRKLGAIYTTHDRDFREWYEGRAAEKGH